MKRGGLLWLSAFVLLAVVIVVLHATHVLPLPPAPPYKNGEGVTITPSNPWTW